MADSASGGSEPSTSPRRMRRVIGTSAWPFPPGRVLGVGAPRIGYSPRCPDRRPEP